VTKLVAGGLRVTREEEIEGLDIGEHGNVAYPDFHASGFPTVEPVPASGAAPAPAVLQRNPAT
jgi:Amt family ammonium transporter